MTRSSQRTQVPVFLALTFLISWTEQYFIIRGGGIQNPLPAFCLMWTPGFVGFVCSLYFDRNIFALALKWPSIRPLLIAYVVPIFVSALAVALLILFSFARFEINPQLIARKGGIGPTLIAVLLIAPTLGMGLAFLSGFGEEVGWRGFLHSKLLNVSAVRRYLVVGFIWSVWHWPLILFGDYATSDKPWLSLIFFTVVTMSIAIVMGVLRDRSKSSIPAVLMHASHNMWVLGIAPVFFKSNGPLTSYLSGEAGLFCAIVYAFVAWGFYRMQSARN